MQIIDLQLKDSLLQENTTLQVAEQKLQKLLQILRQRQLPDPVVQSFNEEINSINNSSLTGNEMLRFLQKKQTNLLNTLEKELKLVPKNYYRNLWMPLGLAAFGVPIGLVFGIALDQMVYLGLGLPLGLVIGMVVGSTMDKKAEEEGRQLDFEQ
jgi:F0F1-type ATP synthase assembly protein I